MDSVTEAAYLWLERAGGAVELDMNLPGADDRDGDV
jgi:hypothetical protein